MWEDLEIVKTSLPFRRMIEGLSPVAAVRHTPPEMPIYRTLDIVAFDHPAKPV
jgi:hypothetical protein